MCETELQCMADRRGSILPFLIIAFIIFSPDISRRPGVRFQQGPTIDDVIVEEERSLSVLQNSSYGDIDKHGDRGLNLTGLELSRGFAWNALSEVKERAKEKLVYAVGEDAERGLEGGGPVGVPLFHNVTGYIRGPWVRSRIEGSIQVPQLNLTQYAAEGPFGQLLERPFGRNITGNSGEVRIRLHEQTDKGDDGIRMAGNVTGISAEMTIVDPDFELEQDLKVYGVYYMDFGQAILTTTSSSKFAGIFALPHFALSQNAFNSSRKLVSELVAKTIKNQRDGSSILMNPWRSNVEAGESPFEYPNCELVIYLQQLPPSSTNVAFSTPLLSFLERELRFPTGAFLPPVPELRFSMLAFSPDCGYALESKGEPEYVPQEGTHLTGPKIEIMYNTGRHHLLIFGLTTGAQLILLIRQMREANTPSTRSRISYYTIGLIAQGDGFAAITFILLSAFMNGVWVALSTSAFLALISVSFFSMRFIMEVWTAQAPEREQRAREEAEEHRRRAERFEEVLRRIRAERLQALEAVQAGTTNVASTEQHTGEQAGSGISAPTEIEGARLNVATQPSPAATQPNPTPQPPAELRETDTAAEAPSNVNPTAPGSLPLRVMAPQPPIDTGATPVFMPSDQQGLEPVTQPVNTTPAAGGPIRIEPFLPTFGSLYARFYLLMLGVLFLSLNAASWPPIIRKGFFTLLAFIYLSFWVPQIYRNAFRNCRRALKWEFVLGQSALRLVPFAYFYAYRHNAVFAEPNLYSLAVLAIWLWIQVVMLGSQEIIGPRWFIKQSWVPPAYDYHPVLREDEEGATMPIGLSDAAGTSSASAPASPQHDRRPSVSARRASTAKDTKAKGRGKRVFDCAICMQDLEVPVVPSGGNTGDEGGMLGGGLLARRNYMVTPCRHIFHTTCLEGWMKYRLQCPICREGLPPL